ncbi:Alpha/Beta hydrolase protein [Gymnopilus junonius]|uniref:Alpha/Beta hydrolase protein n=1 Tax=Gymnopilus junonius TaxID=109634 RepID=A0A9P5NGM9_GYMJU|nr:Alpha/Beta hydrolase protein [Gymnopilus junonius]
MAETPFKIAVPDEKVALLKQKLGLTNFPDEIEESGWDYGVPLADIRRLSARWSDGYDWRKHEAQLNEELPQFTRDIEVEGFGTLNIHYVHKKSEVANAIPLLFVHGWPGSFLEVRKILPLLIEASPEHPSFHVVALGLPGFGFSEAPKRRGFQFPQFAEVGNKLMLALGYSEYVTQGGDWGHVITEKIAEIYGHKYSKARHTNFPLAPPPSITRSLLQYLSHPFSNHTPKEQEALKRAAWFRQKSSGYFEEHATQPQTIGYSLADSPVGLLAWIYEKLVTWTDSYPWEDDEVLTWISIYWFSRAGPAASVRIYFEARQARGYELGGNPGSVTIPTGYSHFPKEVIQVPRRWTRFPNVVFEKEHESGGHFAAFEEPKELVDDLRNMFGRNGPAFGVVQQMNGYA